MSGSSIGTIAGGLIGGIIGFFVPVVGTAIGFSLGATIGGAIGGFIDAPKTPELTGPRLTDLSVQTSTYAAFIPRAYGKIGIYGNIFWIENNKIKETSKKVRQGGKGVGGGGATTKTFTYSATFALGLCEGPIDSIGKIWIGTKLFYNPASENLAETIISNTIANTFSVYLGDDAQLPNARMQATLGAANVPAYRGLAYIVFYDLPLKDYGNSLNATQIKVEVIKKSTSSGFRLLQTFTQLNTTFGPNAVICGAYRYQMPFIKYTLPTNDSRITNGLIDRYNYNVLDNTAEAVKRNVSVAGTTWGAGHGISDSDVIGSADNNPGYIGNSVTEALLSSFGKYYSIRNNKYYTIRANGGMYEYAVRDNGITILSELTFSSPITLDTSTSSNMWLVNTTPGYVYFGIKDLSANRVLLKFEIENRAFVDSAIMPANILGVSVVNDDEIYFVTNTVGTGLQATYDFFATTISLSSTLAKPSVGVGNYAWDVFKVSTDIIAIATVTITGDLTIHTYRLAGPVVPTDQLLSEIVEEECLKSEFLTAGDIDVTELTDIVRGYRVSELSAIRGGIDPLRTAWPFDAIQSGYQIYFKRRGSASVATIDSTLLDARPAGSKDGIVISQSREMDSVLPRKVLLKYFDVTREYDINEQYVERINTEAVNESIIDLSIVLNANEAAQKSEVLLYLYWMERNDLVFSLPPTYSQLEPGDVITITADNADHEVRLTGVNNMSDGRLECKAKYNKATIYSPVALGEEGQSTGVTATLPGPSTYELLDIPLIQSVYDEPGFVLAMTGYLTGWPGGVLYKSTDNGQTFEDVQSVGPPGATMGIASTTIGVHGGTVLDKTSLLTVRMTQGDLSSVTQSQMFDGQNWFAYGADGRWEIIACQNAALQGNGDYILSDFLRGQMGTEWATGLHAVGDIIVHLNSDELAFIPVDSSTITASYIYRGITDEDTIDSDSDKSFSYDAVNLECLSPCQETGSRHPTTNDWTITWTRRTRYAGWRNFVDAELAEDTESYEIDIFSSATFTIIRRTLTSTTQTVQYTSAQQIADFGSNQSTIRVKIYQLSTLAGRGYPLTATLTRT